MRQAQVVNRSITAITGQETLEISECESLKDAMGCYAEVTAHKPIRFVTAVGI